MLPLPKALIIIAQEGYQDRELEGTRAALLEAGFDVILGSPVAGTCSGKLGGKEESAVALQDIQVIDYDRIAFIGGPGAAAFKDDPEALRVARDAVKAEVPLGAICIAPTILAAAGVLEGKRVTGWDDGKGTQVRFIEEHGATFTGKSVTQDGKIITGNGPAAAEEFGKALAAV